MSACEGIGDACFSAGTKLRTPSGYRLIEEFSVGDLILSRDEYNPGGLIEAKVVQEVFERFSEIVHLHVANQTIRTTPKHPFYVFDRSWTPVNEINAGDWILTETGDWQAVQEIYATGEWETVYNLRVEDHHTYFVGDDAWGWSLWAHNACSKDVYIAKDDTNPGSNTAYDKNNGTKIKVTADGKTLPKGTAVSKSTFAEAKKYLLDNQESFGIQASKIDKYDPSDNSDSDIKWREKVGKPDARSRASKPDAVAEFEAFRTAKPTFFTDKRPDPADPTNTDESTWKTGQQLTGDSSYPADMNAFIHAHHIVVRNGDASVRNSHQLLRTVGIDPYYGKTNLAWAPNWTNHRQGTKYRDAVWNDLRLLNITINSDPDAASVASMLDAQAAVKQKLKTIADLFFVANYTM